MGLVFPNDEAGMVDEDAGLAGAGGADMQIPAFTGDAVMDKLSAVLKADRGEMRSVAGYSHALRRVITRCPDRAAGR